MRIFFICVLFSIAGASAFVNLAHSEMQLPVPQLETLPNGLQLAWFLSDHLPVVDLAVLIKSGSRDDGHGKSGTSELVASTLDRGAAGMTAQQIAHSVEMLGASRYSATEEDTFSVGMHGLAPDADALIELLSKVVIHPDFPQVEVDREHARALDRWNHLPDYGETLASFAFRRILSSGTPYGRGTFYSAHEFGNVDRDDVVAFHKKHFTPKNAVLMIVGRVNQIEFRKKVLALFGSWEGEAPKKKSQNFTDPRLKKIRGLITVVDRSSLTQAQVRIGFRAPLINSPDHYPLVVANALLGEYFNSRLNSLIRDKLALTYSIASSFTYDKDLAFFSISTSTRNEAVGQLVKKTLEVLRDLKKGPIGSDEIQMAKDYLTGGFPLSTATLGGVASRWLGGYIFDLGPSYLNEFIPRIRAVSTQDVLNAVGKAISADDAVIVVAGDAKAISKSLGDSGFSRIRQLHVKDML